MSSPQASAAHTTALSFSALAFRAGFTVITNRFTFCNVFLFAACFTLGQPLNTGIINDHFGALNFQPGRGLGHGANIARLHESMDGGR